GLMRVCRTTFARPAANLYAVKHALHQHLAARLADGEPVWLVDSLPLEACRFARAKSCRRLKGDAGVGDEDTRQHTNSRFRLHACCTRDGAIVAFDLAPANVSDVARVDQLRPPPGSVGVGDRNSWSAPVRGERAADGVVLLAPFQNKSKDPDPRRSRRRV